MRPGISRKGNFNESLKSSVSKAFNPHGSGYHMGLDIPVIHDVDANW